MGDLRDSIESSRVYKIRTTGKYPDVLIMRQEYLTQLRYECSEFLTKIDGELPEKITQYYGMRIVISDDLPAPFIFGFELSPNMSHAKSGGSRDE